MHTFPMSHKHRPKNRSQPSQAHTFDGSAITAAPRRRSRCAAHARARCSPTSTPANMPATRYCVVSAPLSSARSPCPCFRLWLASATMTLRLPLPLTRGVHVPAAVVHAHYHPQARNTISVWPFYRHYPSWHPISNVHGKDHSLRATVALWIGMWSLQYWSLLLFVMSGCVSDVEQKWRLDSRHGPFLSSSF